MISDKAIPFVEVSRLKGRAFSCTKNFVIYRTKQITMGGGGSALAAIQSIKYNKSLLRGPKTYATLKSYMQREYDRKAFHAKKAYQGKKVPKEELDLLKLQIIKDIRIQQKRVSILIYSITLIISAIIFGLLFL